MLNRVRQFGRLPPAERWLLLHATLLVAAVRLALWTIPFRLVRRLTLSRQTVSPLLAALPVSRLSWAVQAAARRIPQATCLTQALVMQRFLARAGRHAAVRIGVAKDAEHGFEAHAWVEYQGDIVLGDNTELHRYAPILALRPEGI